MKSFRLKAALATTVAAATLIPASAFAQTADAGDSSDTIVVTARRTSENLQDVPVAITALNAAALDRSTVQELSDVRTIASGLNFNSEGGKNTINVSLRGLGQLPVGLATPGVVTYVNNVAIPSIGSSIPTYDLGNIQVLKGPQGTLFGKTTLGGAILVNTAPATNEFEGYLKATYGRWDYRAIEGAINLPIVNDTIALRLAGQIRRQDPRTKALDNLLADSTKYPGFAGITGVTGDFPGFDDVHQDSFRATLKITPGSGITNTTVFEYFKADELATGLYAFGKGPGFAILGFSPSFVARLAPAVGGTAALNQLLANGVTAQGVSGANPRGAFDGGINGGVADRKMYGLVNTLEIELSDNLTFRNIFGYRKSRNEQLINTAGLPIMDNGGVNLGPVVTQPIIPYWASQVYRRYYLDTESQLLWESDGIKGILGAYYSVDGPDGASGSNFTQFSVTGPNARTTEHVKNRNFSIFGQVNIDLTDQLTLNLGGRYGWDKQTFCYLPANRAGPFGYGSCKDQVAAANQLPTANADGKSVGGVKDNAPAWTIGLDYKVNDDWMVYIASRRGYRPKLTNYPVYESPFVTGDPTACAGFQCPDLRSFQTVKRETVTDVEIGSKLSFNTGGTRGRFNIAAFYSKYKNATQFISNSSIPLLALAPDASPAALIANAADLSIYGVEVDLSVSPTPSITFAFNGAYTKTEVDKLLPIDTTKLPGFGSFTKASVNRLTPKFSGTFSGTWILPVHPMDGDLVLNGDLYITDDYGGQQGFQLKGYELANARLDWKGIGGTGLDLGVFVKNVFDKEYESGVSILLPNQPFNSLYLGQPRTWGVEAKYSF
ncbi:MAG: TonB-dependent receptor [Novosphingobium sp.]|nr:TonB-dependent receptor [Novosphingobium sp.]MCP5388293.1 TonB-dependent receptor [Novosphingobium sp.]